MTADWFRLPIVFAEAKGVAGLGKAGGDGGQGPDKAGQQVPPEVYMALTYAGTLFLFTLSVPLILYGLNKLLNKIEECLGCGASSKAKKLQQEATKGQQREQFPSQLAPGAAVYQHNSKLVAGNNNNNNNSNNFDGQKMAEPDQGTQIHPNGMSAARQNNVQPNQRIGHNQLQFFQNQPKYSQFISMSKPDYSSDHTASNEKNDHHDKVNIDRHHSPPSHLDPNELHVASRDQRDIRDPYKHGIR